ncbi:hypothetical protein PT974_03640 [Cladobotryum mycophilum]|uniref:Uncharacterized protein n=1 Tax=Cladobotryum mycophilum TaxID=491253 RepID=A0ABR0SU43_9HYPO
MPPPLGCPEIIRIPGTAVSSLGPIIKPPIPPFPTRLSQHVGNLEVQLPPLIAGALVTAFAKALSDGLSNELLTHYYLPEQKVRINLDRVLDRLVSEFTKKLWSDLWSFYHNNNSNTEPSRQVKLLFDGPITQLILILNGPETSRCILDKLGPGLSKRSLTWSANAKGIDLPLALQLLCGYWHREFPAQSPGGSPDEIARTVYSIMTTGTASRDLVAEIRKVLLSSHYVQMHLAESAIWDLVFKRRGRPPSDGFYIFHLEFRCDLFGPLDGIGDPQLVTIGSLPAITGTAYECTCTTVSEYVDKRWPKCGRILLGCLQEAISNASESRRFGEPASGMSVWDGSDGEGGFCSGLRLIHLEVEGSLIRMTASAWTHAMIEIFQQMCWTCAVLSSSPFPGALSECAIEVTDWAHDDIAYVACNLSHREISQGEGLPWLQNMRGVAIARGFPPNGL